MVAIPTTLRLAGVEWTVEIVDQARMKEVCEDYKAEVLGACTIHDSSIYVIEGLSKDMTYLTFLHELLHAIRATLGYEDNDDNHDEIDGYSSMFHQFLQTKKGRLI